MKEVAFGLAMAFGLATAAQAATVDLQVEGGGTQQVYELDNGNYLGLWGFDTRGFAADQTLTEAGVLDGFADSSSIVNIYNGPNAFNAGASEFDELTYGGTLDGDTRYFDSLWIEWTGGDLVYNKEIRGGTNTMSASATLDGDPLAPVPLPAGAVLLLTALGGMAVMRRKSA